MSRAKILVSLAVLALAFSATALAGNGYRVFASVPAHRIPSGHLFQVNIGGRAAGKARLYVYLDRQPCLAAWKNEAKRFTTFKAGQSYFRDTQKAFITFSVSAGRISVDFPLAYAGTTAEPEYSCSYLTIPNSSGDYQVTAARRSNAYFVTN